MSETATLSPYEVGSQVNEPASIPNERAAVSAFPKLDGEVMPLVSANADVIAPCRWMGGAEVTLSTAINNYYQKMTEENAEAILSDISEFLASQVTETEDPREEEKLQQAPANQANGDTQQVEESAEAEEIIQEDKSEAEDQHAWNNSNTAEAVEQPAKEANEPLSEQTGSEVEDFIEYENNSPIEAKPQAAVQQEPALSVHASAEAFASLPNNSVNKTMVNTSRASGMSTASEAAVKVRSKDSTTGPMVEAKSVPDNPQLAANRGAETVSLPPAIKANVEIEAELSSIDLENIAIVDDAAELAREETEEYQLAAIEYRTDTDEFTDFIGAELEPTGRSVPTLEVIEDNSETGEEAPILLFEKGTNLLEEVAIAERLQINETNLPVEEIEDALIALAERAEASEPETTEIVDEILVKITELPAKLEVGSDENLAAEEEVEKELEELFAKLFDKLEVDYTPELVESLARLALKWQLAGEPEKLKAKEKTDDEPRDSGTHEIISELLAGLGSIKRSVVYAGAIGKSAITLYSFDYELSLAA